MLKNYFVSLFSNESGFVVTDILIQAGNKHETVVKKLFDPFFVSNDTINTVVSETFGGVPQESQALQHVPNDEGFENVDFEVSIAPANSDGDLK